MRLHQNHVSLTDPALAYKEWWSARLPSSRAVVKWHCVTVITLEVVRYSRRFATLSRIRILLKGITRLAGEKYKKIS
jgi:hypothetical protein